MLSCFPASKVSGVQVTSTQYETLCVRDRNLLYKGLLKQFRVKNIKTPRKRDEQIYEAIAGCLPLRRKKKGSSNFTNDFFNLPSKTSEAPGSSS